jgi:hypothetical protein
MNQQQALIGFRQDEFNISEILHNLAGTETLRKDFNDKNNGQAAQTNHGIKQLEDEIRRLKSLLEDFANDKLIQAQRIRELDREKSLLKQTLAELILEKQSLGFDRGKHGA